MRPPPERSKEALQRRAAKRGRTVEEQRALDRSLLEVAAKERKGEKGEAASALRAEARTPPAGGGGAKGPAPGGPGAAPASLALYIADEGRGLAGHRLECAGRCAAKVLQAGAAKEAGAISVKLRFDEAVAGRDRDRPARRTMQLTISGADALAGKFRIADGSLADWRCTACGFRNFGSRSACNQCHQRRFAEASRPRGDSSAAFPAKIPAAKKTNVDPKRAWVGSVVSPAQLEENRRLRERYAADKGALSADERARAELLLQRDARKKEKKAARRERLAAGVTAPGFRVRKPTPYGR